MPSFQSPPASLLHKLRSARAADPEHLSEALRMLEVCPLTGGRQNHVYAAAVDGTPICIKIYKVDDLRRDEREWAALNLLADHGCRQAPAPLWCDLSSPQPAVGMTLLRGTSLLNLDPPERRAALKGLAETTQRIQRLPLSGPLTWDRHDSVALYMHRLTRTWPAQLADHNDDPLTADMRALLAAWHDSGDAHMLARPAAPVLSRGDANLVNWLQTGDGTACVDFEFAGVGDIATDAADHVEHISARHIPDADWHDLLPDLGVGPAERSRFAAAQRTCALRWLAVLWKQRIARAEEFDTQLRRVRMLQRDGWSA
ncbi:aminoglycoside phosphotransferase family protein [Nonomuraea polychroma]|uniref:aminoglycoside phosphotransferase family protein n=1 Tax=Nonomuraea polychroma TaxID=46176 RepID=UPI003D8BFEB3